MFYVKIIYGFVFFLFVDACQRLYRLSHQYESNNKGDNEGGSGRVVLDERTLSQVRANKFYAQRNFYLTGFTLLLGLILINTQSLLLEITSTKEEIKDLKKGKSDSSASQALDSHKYESTAEELKQLKKRTLDFDTLKKQLDSNQREYDRLSDEYAKLEKKYEAVVAGGDSSSVNAQERKKSN
ncbi:Endoplasmic reticulum transmembrane protein 3 [Mycoemilia scoparia]|uniref:Endoplasmic reticulum transmembrane protein n=1 Tax=Mycoemilia scoparia TaxID=417184 RepID=A0A9W7ZVT6_9FUNG|nr:Endoplasmic reticulum transmembrane protein 3 [Mycoemilia scoparia]